MNIPATPKPHNSKTSQPTARILPMDPIERLHQKLRSCKLCQEAGLIEEVAPVTLGRIADRIMLIGQAPGITERETRRPFNGKSGRHLCRWLESIGITEDEFRSHVYMTAVTKCFPGRSPGGSGDRRPSPREIALCRPWLEESLRLVSPEVILLVGTLSIERYFGSRSLSELIGQRFERDGIILIPLPHPSGASRWLNLPEHKQLLSKALEHVHTEWTRLVPADPSSGPLETAWHTHVG
jgi:uracil-DNA glycosylase